MRFRFSFILFLSIIGKSIINGQTTIDYMLSTDPNVVLALPDGCLDAFRQSVMSRHNELRALHGSQPVKQNASIDASAQNFAIKLAIENSMYHSKTPDLGENLFMKSSSSALNLDTCKTMAVSCVNAWYSEIMFYNFKISSQGLLNTNL